MAVTVDTPELARQHGLKPGESLVFCDLQLLQLLSHPDSPTSVFVANDLRVAGRKVIVKITPHGSREIELLAGLNHPHICPILDVRHESRTDDDGRDTRTGFVAILMPLESITTLRDRLDEEMQPGGRFRTQGWPVVVARFGIDACKGLAEAHNAGIIHADVKSQNLIVNDDDFVRVIDLDRACTGDADNGGTAPGYAPERIDARHAEESFRPNPACDVYSLGVTLFELLTGCFPFFPRTHECEQAAEASMVDSIRRGLPRSPFVDREMHAIIARCTAFDPADRYQTMVELEAALARYVQPRRQFLRQLASFKRLFATVALITAVVLSFGAYRSATAPSEFSEAIAAAELTDYEAALTHADAAVADNPDDLNARFFRARMLVRKAEQPELTYADRRPLWERARDDLDEVYAETQSPKAAALFGYVAARLRMFSNAAALLTAAEQTGAVHINHALALAQLGQHRSALVILQGREDPAALHNLAMAEHMLGNVDGARLAIQDALDAEDAQNPILLANAAGLFAKFGDVNRCLSLLEDAVAAGAERMQLRPVRMQQKSNAVRRSGCRNSNNIPALQHWPKPGGRGGIGCLRRLFLWTHGP